MAGVVRVKRRSPSPHGVEVPGANHGTAHAYSVYGCRCDACRKYMNTYRYEWIRRLNAELLDAATHHCEEWTGPQLEVALNPAKSARRAASELGRTLLAVQQIRAKYARSDPSLVDFVGLPRRTP